MLIDFVLLILLVLLVYSWSKEFLGPKWALFPAFLTLLSPHFISGDVLLTLAFLISIFSFLNFIFHPSKLNLIIAGLALGAAQLVGSLTLYLFIYFLILMIIFYIFGLIRDRNLTTGANRNYRLKIRFLKYFSSLLIIFIIAIAVFYSGLIITKQPLNFNWQLPEVSRISIYNLIQEPLPAIILTALGLGLFLINTARMKNFNLITYLSAHFSNLALIIFMIFGWYASEIFLATLPLIYILITGPIKNFMTSQNEKEAMIVIAHEVFSFSAKWLALFILLFWHVVYTLYLFNV